jgi:hypothetical protein
METDSNDPPLEIHNFSPKKKIVAIVADCFPPPGLDEDDSRHPGASLQLTVPGALISSAQGYFLI